MSEFTFSKTVEGLRIETDFNDMIIRVYKAGQVIRQIDCRKMSLAEYLKKVDQISAEAISKSIFDEN
jgi:hypothetical protein